MEYPSSFDNDAKLFVNFTPETVSISGRQIAAVSDGMVDSKVHGANMGPIWGRQDPGGPHVCPMNFVIRAKLPITMQTGSFRCCS